MHLIISLLISVNSALGITIERDAYSITISMPVEEARNYRTVTITDIAEDQRGDVLIIEHANGNVECLLREPMYRVLCRNGVSLPERETERHKFFFNAQKKAWNAVSYNFIDRIELRLVFWRIDSWLIDAKAANYDGQFHSIRREVVTFLQNREYVKIE